MNKLTKLLTILLFIVIGVHSQIPSNGLTHAYLMNGDGKDASGNGHDLWEIYPSDTVDRNGEEGKAMAFYGQSAFRLPDSTLPTGNDPFSVHLWASNNSVSIPTLIAWGKYPGDFFKIGFNAGGTDIVVTNGIDTMTSWRIPPYYNAQVWIPITVTYDGATTSLFIGDSLVKTQSIAINTSKGGYLGIGYQISSTMGRAYGPFIGSIDQVLIYNRAITQQEVTTLLTCEERINQAPSITSAPITAGIIGESYQYALTANDPDGDNISYELLSEITGMSVNGSTVSWVPSDTGTYNVVISATDGITSSIQEYSITVTEPEFVNTPPVFITTAKTQAKVDKGYAYEMTATDVDEQTLTYLLIEGPAEMTISGNVISWNPTKAGDYDIKVATTDGIDTVYQEYSITVEPSTSAQSHIRPARYNSISRNVTMYTISGRKIYRKMNVNGILIKNGSRTLTLR